MTWLLPSGPPAVYNKVMTCYVTRRCTEKKGYRSDQFDWSTDAAKRNVLLELIHERNFRLYGLARKCTWTQ